MTGLATVFCKNRIQSILYHLVQTLISYDKRSYLYVYRPITCLFVTHWEELLGKVSHNNDQQAINDRYEHLHLVGQIYHWRHHE